MDELVISNDALVILLVISSFVLIKNIIREVRNVKAARAAYITRKNRMAYAADVQRAGERIMRDDRRSAAVEGYREEQTNRPHSVPTVPQPIRKCVGDFADMGTVWE